MEKGLKALKPLTRTNEKCEDLMSKTFKWECQRVDKNIHPISKKEMKQRLDEILNLLLNKAASSESAFSTKIPVFPKDHASHGDVQPLQERILHDKAI
jgi:hypothetical protein